MHIGDRSVQSAKRLWQSLPPVYRGAGDAPPPVNVQFVTLILGQRMNRFYLVKDIKQSVKTVARLAILNDLTTLYGKELDG